MFLYNFIFIFILLFQVISFLSVVCGRLNYLSPNTNHIIYYIYLHGNYFNIISYITITGINLNLISQYRRTVVCNTVYYTTTKNQYIHYPTQNLQISKTDFLLIFHLSPSAWLGSLGEMFDQCIKFLSILNRIKNTNRKYHIKSLKNI